MRERDPVFEHQALVNLDCGGSNQEIVQFDGDQVDLEGIELVELLVTIWGIVGTNAQLVFEMADTQDTPVGSSTAVATYTAAGVTPGASPQTPVLISVAYPRTSPFFRRRFLRWRWTQIALGDYVTFRSQLVVR